MYTYNNKYQTISKNDTLDHQGYKYHMKEAKPLLYDKKNNKYLGRTPINWAYFMVFFFACMFAMIAVLVAMFFAFTEGVINEDAPYRSGFNSILNNIPSLSFRPVIDFKTALIRYADADPSTYMMYIQNMRALVETYEDKDLVSEDSYALCEDGKKTPDDIYKPCRYNILLLNRCIKQYNFGYDRTKPCVILKLNRIYGWVPDVVNGSKSRDILVSCRGQNTEDVENFKTVRYYPNVTIDGNVYGYFNSLYYPYLVQYGYRQPLLGVELDQPKKNVILMVTCSLVNLQTKSLPLTFEILID